ncbi:MAG: ATP synthase subunit I [candidate division NC10 bacterium]|nr:ATP synthase subunit I [candidate division NC10 bacterium]
MGALVVGASGGLVLLLFGRAGWAIAFSLGAAISLGNFHLITRAVGRLADPNPAQASRHLWKGALFRFAAVGIVLFLAVAVLQVNVLALLAGLVITQLGMIGYWLWRSARADPK